MPISLLKELLAQYEAWQQAGGTRTSIADPLPWEEEEEGEEERCDSSEKVGAETLDESEGSEDAAPYEYKPLEVLALFPASIKVID